MIVEEYLLIAPGISLGLLADGLSLPTLAVVLLLCTALAFYSIRYVEHRVDVLYKGETLQTRTGYYARFFYLFPFFPVGFIGTILSTNLVSLYFFMEVLTIALFFLMAFFGYRERVRVAFISLSWGIIGALLFLAASLVVYSQIGSLEISELERLASTRFVTLAIALFVVGLMMKLALVPFHVWMPWVHAEHPTCIAGLLAVYANLALYIIVRVIVVPLRGDFEPFGAPLMALALLTMIYGALLALAQTDIKRLAACSTISQIAYSVLGLGALTTASVDGGMFFFLSHIMGKTIFFSTAGICRVHDRDPRHAGDGRSGAEDAGYGRPLGDGLYDALRVSAVQQLHCGVDHVHGHLRAGIARRPVWDRDRGRGADHDCAHHGVLVRCCPPRLLRSPEPGPCRPGPLRPLLDDDRPTAGGRGHVHAARNVSRAGGGTPALGDRADLTGEGGSQQRTS